MSETDGPLAAWRSRPHDARAVVLLDFDGTLAEFNPDPAAVRIPEQRRGLLRRLAARADLSGGLVSGRRLADLRERAGGDPALYYAGLHGLEAEGPGFRFVHSAVSAAAPTIGLLVRELRDATRALAGVLIEDKGFSVAVHVRAASPPDARHAMSRFQAIAEPYLAGGLLRVQPGDEMAELLPNVDWNKGNAVRLILNHVRTACRVPVWPVYIGDDATDEDAFEEIGDSGLTIAVSARTSGAAFRVTDPEAVERFLRLALVTE